MLSWISESFADCAVKLGTVLIAVLGVIPGRVSAAEMTRKIEAPTRVVAAMDTADVEKLLLPRWGQVAEGTFLEGSGAMLATNGWLVLDFGRELHGNLVIGCGAKSGHNAKVHVRFGESVAEALSPLGERGACNDHAIRDDVISLPWYGKREIGSTGFRFVYLANAGKEPLQIEFANAISIMRDMKPVGSFRCSDERVNRIFDTAVRTARLCCQDYLWDGIKRDRLVWIGDFHPELATIGSVFGGDTVLRDSLQYAIETTPLDEWMNTMPTYTCWFMRDVYGYFMTSGDDLFCRTNCPYLAATARKLAEAVGPDGEYLLPGTFLDWPTKHDPEAEKAGARALLAITLDECAYLMDVFHESETMAKCTNAAARLRKVMPDPHGKKTAAALLALGRLAEPKRMYDEYLGKNGCEGVSTFYGYYVLEAMSAAGENKRALETIRDYWGGMLDMGATSFWEDFNLAWTNNAFRIDQMPVRGKKDIHGDYGDFCYVGFRHSLCHGWSSGPAAWMINHVLGLRLVEPGGYVVECRPDLAGLDWAEGSIATAYGPVRVSVRKDAEGNPKVDITAPSGVEVRGPVRVTKNI